MNGLIEGKKYVLSTPVDTVITDVKYNIQLGTVKAGQQYVFQAVSDAVTVADGCTIRPFEGSNGASVGIVGGSGDGGSSGGSSAYPGWVGYIEYDDETGEAIAADYSGLEIGGPVPSSLMFTIIKFRGDWKGGIGKFTDGSSMFQSCTNLTSFNGDLSSLTNGSSMFVGCSALTSFSVDLSSLTNGNHMFYSCSNLSSFNGDLSSLTNGSSMFYGCSKLTSFTSDLSSLTNGSNMFQNCDNLTSFSVDLTSLTNGNNMFGLCDNLTSFSVDLSSLTNGEHMFTSSPLDATSIEKILLSIPTYSDGTTHNLGLGVSLEQAGDKFTEITGATLNPKLGSYITVAFKGWQINAYSYR